ncbi:TetR/AcrR family transcriptional regulator [Actinocrispum wychmicini]|uniref:TetR/AcrR family transcriptional regulator n=1 Tax=Actinocrispum wychmicini TaxID=1213861 RepID=UPI001404AA2B|nr:TetR/AcrR family transcriptional regulator [Actinocrispum wychmicini]
MTKPRPLRTDAARNAESLVLAAWRAFGESGSDIPLEEVAKRAGVGVATLYRRFPSKEDLLLAVLEWRYAEEIEPVLRLASADEDPWRAMVTALEAAFELAVKAHRVIRAARDPGALVHGLKTRYTNGIVALVRRAQDAGVVRDDLTDADIEVAVFMLFSTVRLVSVPSTVWRRGVGVLLDGLRPERATPLPPVGPD